MHYVFYGTDKPDSLDLRVENRPAHVAWLKNQPIPLAGPLLNANGDMMGSMVVCEADSIEEAKTMFEADPYAQAGLFASTEITPWNWVIGKPEQDQ
jgi:hypothetical protein